MIAIIIASVALSSLIQSTSAASAQVFSPPSLSPTTASTNYTGAANGTIVNSPVVPGKQFDRFVQIWLENTDYATAASSPVFQTLAANGILMNGFFAVTHPSEANYIAVATGNIFGFILLSRKTRKIKMRNKNEKIFFFRNISIDSKL